MGILSKTVETVEPHTPESLKNVLIEAAADRDAVIAEAKDEYNLDKEWVYETAAARATVVGGLLDELTAEKQALDEVLSEASR